MRTTAWKWLGMYLLAAGMAGPCAQASQEGPALTSRAVTTPPLSATGYRYRPRQVITPTLRATGYREEPTAGRRFSLMRIVPLDAGTNPFDYEDVRRDVLAARTPGGVPVDGNGGVGPAAPLTYTGLTLFGEGAPAYIKIDADGPNTLSAFPTGPDGNTALIFNVSMGDDSTGSFDAGPAWQIVSRSHANPVNEMVHPRFVVRRLAGGNYYQVDVIFSNTGAAQYSIDLLSGFNCGASAAACP